MRYLILRLKRFCGYIVGFVFFISGILKLLDPVGAGLVVDEYYRFLHIGFMSFSSRVMGTVAALAEVTVGTGLITGVWRRPVAQAAIILQSAFTLLTLALVIFKPEMDCGCFGEAIHLTHTQTFVKNIILLILLITYYIPRKRLGHARRKKYVSFGIVTVSVIGFTIFSWMFKPLIDFTDYRTGAELLAADNAIAEDLYESVFTYEKDGIREEFTLGHLPDSTWTFVNVETRLKPGHETTSIELSFYDPETGEYQDSLAAKGQVMVVSVYSPSGLSSRKWAGIARFIDNATRTGFRTLLLTSTDEDVPEGMRYYLCDFKTLVSLNRSNGGVAYFHDGELVEKWARRTAPDKEVLREKFEADPTEILIEQESKGSLVFQGFLLYVFAVMLLL
ncbi:MAG: hypothetical protein E7118_02915 [Bacteroidales bacterium]|nr:hypothetical protein [Bacteroidales bacterium]